MTPSKSHLRVRKNKPFNNRPRHRRKSVTICHRHRCNSEHYQAWNKQGTQCESHRTYGKGHNRNRDSAHQFRMLEMTLNTDTLDVCAHTYTE